MRNREPRSKVVLSAQIRLDGRWSQVTIRDLSSRGMLLSSRTPPRPGTYFEISGPGASFVARTVWVNGDKFGVRIQDRIDVEGAVRSGALKVTESPNFEPAAPAPKRAANQNDARHRGRLFEHGSMVVAGFTAAAVIALLIFSVLSTPFRAIAETLGQ